MVRNVICLYIHDKHLFNPWETGLVKLGCVRTLLAIIIQYYSELIVFEELVTTSNLYSLSVNWSNNPSPPAQYISANNLSEQSPQY